MKMRMHQPQTSESTAPRPLSPKLRHIELPCVPHDHVRDPTAAINEHPDLTPQLSRSAREVLCQLDGDDLLGWNYPSINSLEAVELARLQPIGISSNWGRDTDTSCGTWIIGPAHQARKRALSQPTVLSGERPASA
jgi:hypothetical protein